MRESRSRDGYDRQDEVGGGGGERERGKQHEGWGDQKQEKTGGSREKGELVMVLVGEEEEEEDKRVKQRWVWNRSGCFGGRGWRVAVIYCPWLIRSKCVEPSARRVEREEGGGSGCRGEHREVHTHRLLGLSAGLLGACQQPHHPLP